MLLHHAFQEEREGWRIWVDTLAILHGKVGCRVAWLSFVASLYDLQRWTQNSIGIGARRDPLVTYPFLLVLFCLERAVS